MSVPESVHIIGAGHAGTEAAFALRQHGFKGQIHLFSNEAELPYNKPPLSKDFLMGKSALSNLYLRSEEQFNEQNIEFHASCPINQIDNEAKVLVDENGKEWSYECVILATGAQNKKLPKELCAGIPTYYLRHLHEAVALKELFQKAKRVAIVGGGFIGLEVAAAAIQAQVEVHLIEAQERLMQRVLPKALTNLFEQEHRQQGVKLYLNTQLLPSEQAGKIKLSDGNTLEVDAIIVGIGVQPSTSLAEKAGLQCANGVVVNKLLQSSDANIYAIGDLASFPNSYYQGRFTRLESIQNAKDMGLLLAKNIVNASSEPYVEVPWFWTHQYGLKLQMAGFNQDYDQIVVRDADSKRTRFSLFYFKSDKLIGVDSLNKASDHIQARKLLASSAAVSPDQVGDPSIPLKSLLPY